MKRQDVIINELSLDGQYKDVETFAKSLAESHARDAVLLSYQGGGYDKSPINELTH